MSVCLSFYGETHLVVIVRSWLETYLDLTTQVPVDTKVQTVTIIDQSTTRPFIWIYEYT